MLEKAKLGSISLLLAGKIGDYKLCYQSPSGSDSVEQKSNEGVIQIKAPR